MLSAIMSLLVQAAGAQAAPTVVAPAPKATPAPAPQPASAPEIVTIPHDQPIELMVVYEVTGATPGRIFNLRVNRPVMVNGRVILPAGTMAYGEVLDVKYPGFMTDDGEVSARLRDLDVDGVRVPLVASANSVGSGGLKFRSSGSFVYLVENGDDAKIRAGVVIYGSVASDTRVDMSNGVARVSFAPPPGK